MNLANLHPIQTYQYLVNTDGSKLYDGAGAQIINLELTTSHALYQVSWEESSSYASSSTTASFVIGEHTGSTFGTASWSESSSVSISSSFSEYVSSASFIWPSAGIVNDMQNATGSSTGNVGFASASEMDSFILAVSQSFITINDLLLKLREKGIIS